MKRARYTGASGTGVSLTVTLPDGQIREVHIPHGDLTPEAVAGQLFPETVVESLCDSVDWALEDDTPPAPAKKTSPAAGEKE